MVLNFKFIILLRFQSQQESSFDAEWREDLRHAAIVPELDQRCSFQSISRK